MGISSVGLGSGGVLTQDLLDKLRKSDENAQITPIDLNIASENDKKNEYNIIEANVQNLSDSIEALKNATVFDARVATTSGSSAEMTADDNSDVQDFTLDVKQLATKEITESGQFGGDTDKIATDNGTMTLHVGGTDYDIDYNADMSLKDLKNAINDKAGDDVTASIIKVADDDYHLYFTAKNTGDLNSDNNSDGTDDNLDISITDNDGNLSDDGGSTNGGTNLTDNISSVQVGHDAVFTFNGGDDITRASNDVNDLISGYHIDLKSTGSTDVSVARDDESIITKIDSFVAKYNATMTELGKATKPSANSSERGIFSGDSQMKSMQSDLRSMMDNAGGGVGTLYDYGFDIDRDGKMSIDKTVFEDKLQDDPSNLEIFFTGGDFDNGDDSTTTVKGAFSELFDISNSYTKYNGMLDTFKDNLDNSIKDLTEHKSDVKTKLDDKYDTMSKQFNAYSSTITKYTNDSAFLTNLINSEKKS